MGASRPKAFLGLAGQPLLLRSALAFDGAPSVDGIVAVVPAEEIESARGILGPVRKLRAVVAGGSRRQDSVLEGLKQAPDGFAGVVLVHDAARPLVDVPLVEAVARAAAEQGAALPVLGLVDTVKRVRDGQVRGDARPERARGGPDAPGLPVRAARGGLRGGLPRPGDADRRGDGGGAARAARWRRCRGRRCNRKITTPEDLAWAEGGAERDGAGVSDAPRRPGLRRAPPGGGPAARPRRRAGSLRARPGGALRRRLPAARRVRRAARRGRGGRHGRATSRAATIAGRARAASCSWTRRHASSRRGGTRSRTWMPP